MVNYVDKEVQQDANEEFTKVNERFQLISIERGI